jgi:gliding motility-associated-like protein
MSKKLITIFIIVLNISLLKAQVYDTVDVFQTDSALRCHIDTLVLDAGEGFASYIWSTGENSQRIKVTENGTYDVTASDAGGQISETECYVNIINASIMQESDSLCYKDTIFLVIDETDYRYQWNTNPDDTLYNAQVILTSSKLYTVDIYDNVNSCRDSVKLDMYPRIYVEFEQNQENKGCPGGDCKGQVRVFVSGGTGNLSIEWDTPNVDPGDSSYAIGLCEGPVGVHVYDDEGCRFDTSYWVEVWDMPEIETTADTTTYIQDPRLTFWFENLSQDSISLSNYFWALRDGTSSNLPDPTFAFGALGEHIVRFEYTTMDGCVDSNLITITVESVRLLVPNVFTPNGDGANDTFIITIRPPDEEDPQKSISASSIHQPINDFYISNELVIFNRWGKRVFEATNYNNDWDGGNLPEGTYFYVLKCQGTQGEDDFRGAVTILR